MKILKQRRASWYVSLAAALCAVVLEISSAAAGCSAGSTSINFGSYDFLSPAPTTGSGTITLSCTSSTTVRVAIGQSFISQSYYPRQLQLLAGNDVLNYNIYTSAALAQIWGDGSHGTTTITVPNVKRTNTPPLIMYGRIEPQQNVTPGSYDEQLVVTILY